MNFEFNELPYAYDALEPYFDKMTMEIHHGKHHRAYYDKFVAAIKGTEYENMCIREIFSKASLLPAAVKNNGGGYWNHNLFWKILSPNGTVEPKGKLIEIINQNFASFENFKKEFTEIATNQFGSGWAWLSVKDNATLCISSSSNQDNPLMDTHSCNAKPILTLDVWEHSYYLKYQNKRPDYIAAFWNIVNWDAVYENYEKEVNNI